MSPWRACPALLLAACVSCQSTSERRGPTPPTASARDPAVRAAVREALAGLPAVSGESFASFCGRARAALAASDREAAKRALSLLPDDVRLFASGPAADLAPTLLAAFARSRSEEARVEALQSLIRHPTINPPDTKTPGRNPAFDAFEADLKARAEALGLAFDHVGHVAYEVTFPDAKGAPPDRKVGVLVHADVVPADEPGWMVPPFAGVVKDGRIYGRGALDDKGALEAVLFALDALEESGLRFLKSPALIVGTSEETHWDGIDRFVKERGLPEAIFVADGSFPVGIGEKGIATVRIRALPTGAEGAGASRLRLLFIRGGQVVNQVPAEAEAVLTSADAGAREALLARLRAANDEGGAKLSFELEGETLRVLAHGKAAHTASPDEGENALSHLARFLAAEEDLEGGPCLALVRVLDARLGTGFSAAGLGVPDEHPRFSPSTAVFSMLEPAPDGSCTATLSLRWPPPRSAEEVVASVKATVEKALREAPGGPFAVEVKGGGLDPFLMDEESPLVASLKDAYATVTGKKARAITLSGTTYAKAVPGGGVTFGPAREEDKGARIHCSDEHITLEELAGLVEIYTFALAALALRPR